MKTIYKISELTNVLNDFKWRMNIAKTFPKTSIEDVNELVESIRKFNEKFNEKKIVMIAVSKTSKLKIEIVSVNGKVFTGKVIKGNAVWKPGEYSHNFSTKDFNIEIDLAEYVEMKRNNDKIFKHIKINH